MSCLGFNRIYLGENGQEASLAGGGGGGGALWPKSLESYIIIYTRIGLWV